MGDNVSEVSSIGINVGMLLELRVPNSVVNGKSCRDCSGCSGLDVVSS